jgi:hypothetical protein
MGGATSRGAGFRLFLGEAGEKAGDRAQPFPADLRFSEGHEAAGCTLKNSVNIVVAEDTFAAELVEQGCQDGTTGKGDAQGDAFC